MQTTDGKTTRYSPPETKRSMLKTALVAAVEALFFICLLPLFALFKTGLSRYITCTTLLSLLPGAPGWIMRRVWYRNTLQKCGKNLCVDFMGWIRTAKTEVGDNVYIGISSFVGLATIGNDVLISGHVTMLSGMNQHDIGLKGTPMAKSGGADTRLLIGNDVWIGAGAVVGNDVADGCIVGAGAVVVHPTNPNEIVGGVPAKFIRKRFEE